MNPRIFFVLVALTGLTAAALLSCGCSDDSGLRAAKTTSVANDKAEEPSHVPPLVVDKNAPLLLDEPAERQTHSPAATADALTDNFACFVCHANYKAEPLVGWHAAVNLGCVTCHGKSYAHRNDENNTTPPDIMYPVDEIDRSCRKCHTTHNVPAAKVIVRWQQRRSNKTHLKIIVCTDCHGTHRLKLRTVQWDKKTGKLLRSSRTP